MPESKLPDSAVEPHNSFIIYCSIKPDGAAECFSNMLGWTPESS